MNEPKLRFKGFGEKWEERSLGDCVKIFSGHSPNNFITGSSDSYPLLKVNDLNFSIKYQYGANEYVLKHDSIVPFEKDMIVFPKRGAAILTNKLRIIKMQTYADTNIMGLKIVNDDLEFFYYLLSKEGLYKIADTSTIPQINNKHIEPYVVTIPCKSEQVKISEFLSVIDKKIQIQKQKMSLLQEQKKGYMQKIFKQGIRFKGFNEEWKQWKLGELAEVRTGKAFSSADFNDNGEYLVVTNKNIQDEANGIKSVGDRIDIHDDVILNNYLLSGDNILVTMDGVNIGKTGKYSNEKAVLAQRVGRLNSEQIDFVYQITSSNKFVSEMNKLSVGNAIKHISLKHISDYSFSAPTSKREQEKIGSFFKKIDRKIQLLQQKIDLLQEQKKGFIQQMFV